jgi:hypothetical protein
VGKQFDRTQHHASLGFVLTSGPQFKYIILKELFHPSSLQNLVPRAVEFALTILESAHTASARTLILFSLDRSLAIFNNSSFMKEILIAICTGGFTLQVLLILVLEKLDEASIKVCGHGVTVLVKSRFNSG